MFVNVPIGVVVLLLARHVVPETERRHGHFDVVGAVTSTCGMSAVVFGLVEAGNNGWTNPVTLIAFVIGVGLLAAFVVNERRAEEPILPLRLFAHSTRTTANVARGLVYAGMYGMFFFLSQFFQDVQGYSPLHAGIAFLPMPASVFLASQFTSRVLSPRVPQKALMMAGATFAAVSLALATQIHANSTYGEIVVAIVLLGIGAGISFVSLTSASLTDVEPHDAGAASGLVNVSQQLGAAVGLAVLVTVFGVVTKHAQLGGHVAHDAVLRLRALTVHGLDDVFAIGIVFTLVALVLIAGLVRTPRVEPSTGKESSGDWGGDAQAEEWLGQRPVAEAS
jgi:MFS family permease